MECSICYNEITSATGKVDLSCSHSFHFSCLTKWFQKQKSEDSQENCPLCRHESTEFEKMPQELDDEFDEDDEESWEYDTPSDSNLAAQERARQRFAKYKRINSIEEVQLYSANLIKACWRGYQDRLNYCNLLTIKEDVEYYERQIIKFKDGLENIHIKAKLLSKAVGLTRFQWKTLNVRKIQNAWKKYLIRKNRSERLVILADTSLRVELHV